MNINEQVNNTVQYNNSTWFFPVPQCSPGHTPHWRRPSMQRRKSIYLNRVLTCFQTNLLTSFKSCFRAIAALCLEKRARPKPQLTPRGLMLEQNGTKNYELIRHGSCLGWLPQRRRKQRLQPNLVRRPNRSQKQRQREKQPRTSVQLLSRPLPQVLRRKQSEWGLLLVSNGLLECAVLT